MSDPSRWQTNQVVDSSLDSANSNSYNSNYGRSFSPLQPSISPITILPKPPVVVPGALGRVLQPNPYPPANSFRYVEPNRPDNQRSRTIRAW